MFTEFKGSGEKMGEKAKSEKVKITHQVKRIRGSIEKQTQCIQCRSRAVRIIGKDQYFCADCCTEFKVCGNKVTVYTIGTDGIKYELWWIYLPVRLKAQIV